jgi:hypothetical protein
MPIVDVAQPQHGYRFFITDRIGFTALVKQTFMSEHVSLDVLGIAFPPKGYAFMHAQDFLQFNFFSGPVNLPSNQLIEQWEHTMAHEIGHLFGLWHDNLTDLDSVQKCVGNKYNLMAVDTSVPLVESAVTPEQVKQMHNRLSGGRISNLYKGEMWLGVKDFVDPAISLGNAVYECSSITVQEPQ